jgi:hypothetical protein
MTCETSQNCFKEATARKEEELGKHKTSKAPSPAKEKENLTAAGAVLERRATERQEAALKHEAARQEAEKKFQADFEEAQMKLNQVKELFQAEMRAAREEWEELNGALTTELKKAKVLAEQRAEATAPTTAAAGANVWQRRQQTCLTSAALPVPDDQPATAAVVTTAAQKLVNQLNHRVEMDISELADVTIGQPNPQEMMILARIWSWVEAMNLEDPTTLVYFKDVGAEISVLIDLVGKTVWERMFPEQAPSLEDVLPFQLRSIVASQMRQLASRLSGDDFKVARQEGAAACKEQRTRAAAPY